MLIECHLFVSTIDKLCWGILIICSLVDKRSGPSVDMLVSSETTMLIKLNTATCKEIQLGTFAKNRNIPLGFGLVLHFFFIHQFLAHCGARPQVFRWFVPYISLILWQLHPKILHLGGVPVNSFTDFSNLNWFDCTLNIRFVILTLETCRKTFCLFF